MPLPRPGENEDKPEFIGRCMAAQVMRDEYPDSGQRYAVCKGQWERDKEKQ